MNEIISWPDFEKVILCVGTVVRAEEFPQARKPAYKVWVDFGSHWGVKKSSAQITAHYTPKDLVGRQVLGVLNFPVKQIGPFQSECLITGVDDGSGSIVLLTADKSVPNGARLH